MGPPPPERSAAPGRTRLPAALLALLIAAAVVALYARTSGFGYVFDDQSYVVGNPGLTPVAQEADQRLRRALRTLEGH